MAANYNRPKPIDPIWYRSSCWLRIRCACGNNVIEQLGRFARRNRIHPDTLAHELIERLRCSRCGSPPSFAEVTRHRTGN